MRSRRVSPIPIRMPLVNGTQSSPAARMVSSRTCGSLSGQPWWGPPRAHRRSATDSSISPADTETGRSRSRSARLITPGLTWGSSPVASCTRCATSARYAMVVS